ncbi:MAG: formate--tetrahydrofolate ligase, partial [Propionibacterium sp.]|nr:formate--tetrahydrofolate ligase [Propionibacterium sp.]
GRGMANLERHVENLRSYGVPVLVAINRFPADTEAELALVRERCTAMGVRVVDSEVFAKGADGGIELANAVVEMCEHPTQPARFQPLYRPEQGLRASIERVAREIYRADSVHFTSLAESQLARLTKAGFGGLPVCIAKTQYSFSDDPHLLGAPTGFEITVRELSVRAGAGFVVAFTGNIMTMPGLPRHPAAAGMDIEADGTIIGLS